MAAPGQQAMGQPLTGQQAPSYGAMQAVAPGQVSMTPHVLNQTLMNLPAVQIHGKRRMAQEIFGFEQNSKYFVGPLSLPGEKPQEGNELFFAAEKSTWCEKNCYPPGCGPWRLDLFQMPFVKNQSQPLLHMEKPFSCTCCCLNRPEAVITDLNTQQAIGSIRDPFKLFDLDYQVKDANGEVVMIAHGGCCQMGLCCPLPGTDVVWTVRDTKSQEVVATIKKIWKLGDLCPCLSKNMDWFEVNFGTVSDASAKSMVTLLAIFIDYMAFNQRNQAGQA